MGSVQQEHEDRGSCERDEDDREHPAGAGGHIVPPVRATPAASQAGAGRMTSRTPLLPMAARTNTSPSLSAMTVPRWTTFPVASDRTV